MRAISGIVMYALFMMLFTCSPTIYASNTVFKCCASLNITIFMSKKVYTDRYPRKGHFRYCYVYTFYDAFGVFLDYTSNFQLFSHVPLLYTLQIQYSNVVLLPI